MSDAHATDAPGHGAAAGGDPHATSDHGGAPGHDDDAHEEAALGPIDAAAWGAGVLGIAIAIMIAVAFALATGGPG